MVPATATGGSLGLRFLGNSSKIHGEVSTWPPPPNFILRRTLWFLNFLNRFYLIPFCYIFKIKFNISKSKYINMHF